LEVVTEGKVTDPTLLNFDKIKHFASENEAMIQQRKQKQEEDEPETANDSDQREKLRQMVKKSNQKILDYNELYEENELFNKCGELQKVLGPESLSGEYAEYQVTYNKLFFESRVIIFELKITNTLADTTIKNVTADLKYEN